MDLPDHSLDHYRSSTTAVGGQAIGLETQQQPQQQVQQQ